MAQIATLGWGIPKHAGSRGGWVVTWGYGSFQFTTRVIKIESSLPQSLFVSQRHSGNVVTLEPATAAMSQENVTAAMSQEGLAAVISMAEGLTVSSNRQASQYSSSEGSTTAESQEPAATAESTENVTMATTIDPSELDEG
jgi:hypothetical protein